MPRSLQQIQQGRLVFLTPVASHQPAQTGSLSEALPVPGQQHSHDAIPTFRTSGSQMLPLPTPAPPGCLAKFGDILGGHHYGRDATGI